jgi:sulfide:quinone oxidoreductase
MEISILMNYLIVAPGIQIDWDAIPGLAENLGTNGICSIYSYRNLDYTEECIKQP